VRAWLLALSLVLAGCGTEVGGTPEKDTSPTVGAVSLVVPVELRPVADEGTTVLKDPTTGESLALADPIMTIEQLDGAEISSDNGTWALVLHLNTKDTRTFADWTSAHTGERLAIVIDGDVVVAPTIQAAITGGDVQVSGNYTRDDVEKLLDEITGR
jgi:preprotein translocase subunit SecD